MNRTQLIATLATIPVPRTEFDRSGSRHQALTAAAAKFGEVILDQVPESDARSAALQALTSVTRAAVDAIAPVPAVEPTAAPAETIDDDEPAEPTE
jgi:hypothetical protein